MSDQAKPPENPAPAETGVVAEPAAAAETGVVTQPAAAVPPDTQAERPWLKSWIFNRLLNFALVMALWLLAGVLLYLYGWETANAIGFGLIAAFFGAFFLRPVLMPMLTKAYPSLYPAPEPTSPASPVESGREVIETVVFVVVLVLLLKSFVAEAFVIPTGSMAETLWGYQKVITCPQCKYKFPINCSNEVEEPASGNRQTIDRCTCPNCRQKIRLLRLPAGSPVPEPTDGVAYVLDPGWRSGDRVLVSKDLPGMGPRRLDVVVFKFPGDDPNTPGQFPNSGPFKDQTPMNYIKRLIGLPGETVVVHRGKLYVLPASAWGGEPYPEDVKAAGDPDKAPLMWRTKGVPDWMHVNDTRALTMYDEGKASIVRKPPAVLLDIMRIVYDNDLPARDLKDDERHRRWVAQGEDTWAEDEKARSFRSAGGAEGLAWLRYRHVLRDDPTRPQLITDFLGYNTSDPDRTKTGVNWATDLILECDVTSEKADGTFAVELSRGPSRFQAVFDVGTGECTLNRIRGGKTEVLKQGATGFKGAGTFRLRLANCDDRLTLWVNGSLPFGDGVEYGASKELLPVKENDLDAPAGVGAKGGRFAVKRLKLYRDTYYTAGTRSSDPDVTEFKPDNPSTWDSLAKTPKSSFYVQPGHYLCMGDNSPQSSDGRSWGMVPQRLMLGRAVMVYFPFTRVGRIR